MVHFAAIVKNSLPWRYPNHQDSPCWLSVVRRESSRVWRYQSWRVLYYLWLTNRVFVIKKDWRIAIIWRTCMFVHFAFSEAWGDKIQRCVESLLSLRVLAGVKCVMVHFAENVKTSVPWRYPIKVGGYLWLTNRVFVTKKDWRVTIIWKACLSIFPITF